MKRVSCVLFVCVFLIGCKPEAKINPEFPICEFDIMEIVYNDLDQTSVIQLKLVQLGYETMARAYSVSGEEISPMIKMYEQSLFDEITDLSAELMNCGGAIDAINPNFSQRGLFYMYSSGKTCFTDPQEASPLKQRLQWLIDDVLSTGIKDELNEPYYTVPRNN